jgi:hypothetical protein
MLYRFLKDRIVPVRTDLLTLPARVYELAESVIFRDFMKWCRTTNQMMFDLKTFRKCMMKLFPDKTPWENLDETRGNVGFYYTGLAYFPNGYKDDDPFLQKMILKLDLSKL